MCLAEGPQDTQLSWVSVLQEPWWTGLCLSSVTYRVPGGLGPFLGHNCSHPITVPWLHLLSPFQSCCAPRVPHVVPRHWPGFPRVPAPAASSWSRPRSALSPPSLLASGYSTARITKTFSLLVSCPSPPTPTRMEGL